MNQRTIIIGRFQTFVGECVHHANSNLIGQRVLFALYDFDICRLNRLHHWLSLALIEFSQFPKYSVPSLNRVHQPSYLCFLVLALLFSEQSFRPSAMQNTLGNNGLGSNMNIHHAKNCDHEWLFSPLRNVVCDLLAQSSSTFKKFTWNLPTLEYF